MRQPPALQKGDTVGIVSTARKISRKELKPAVAILEQWGLRVKKGKNLFKKNHQQAGTAQERLHDLQTFIEDENIRAIFCARGGYGTVQLIDEVNFFKLIEAPKWLVGYSDVTVLHNKLSLMGIESLHASMPINFKENSAESLESLRQALFRESYEISAPSHPFNQPGKVKAEITGGNLSMLYSQCGSETALQTAGKILFFEDLDEYLYHIDRMLYNLKRNGYFKALAGVIVGGLTDMNDNTIPFGATAEEITHQHLQALKVPVAFGFPAGHLPDNRALIFGKPALLEVTPSGSKLKFTHG
jgi:muramoyltetrapeptide carboxypeptidase